MRQRLEQLREWASRQPYVSTGTAQDFYRTLGINGRSTARHDLEKLSRDGVLQQHRTGDRVFYTPVG